MSFRKEWVMFFSYGCFLLCRSEGCAGASAIIGQWRSIPALSFLYGKALCFLNLITSVRDYKQSDWINAVSGIYVQAGNLLLLFQWWYWDSIPTSCHDRRASVLKWKQWRAILLLLFITVAPFILFKKVFFNIIILLNENDVKQCLSNKVFLQGLYRPFLIVCV
jgi:hypothetical protein